MDLLHTEERLSEADAVTVARSIVTAVEFCHSRNISHRDIKGDNILFRKDEFGRLECKLADFGGATYFEKYDQVFSEKVQISLH